MKKIKEKKDVFDLINDKETVMALQELENAFVNDPLLDGLNYDQILDAHKILMEIPPNELPRKNISKELKENTSIENIQSDLKNLVGKVVQ